MSEIITMDANLALALLLIVALIFGIAQVKATSRNIFNGWLKKLMSGCGRVHENRSARPILCELFLQ